MPTMLSLAVLLAFADVGLSKVAPKLEDASLQAPLEGEDDKAANSKAIEELKAAKLKLIEEVPAAKSKAIEAFNVLRSTVPKKKQVKAAQAGMISIALSVVTKSWGYENMVTIDDANVTGLPAVMGNNMIYNTSVYLTPGYHTFELFDSFGDGWHGGYITVNGVKYGLDFTSGGYKSYDIPVGIAVPVSVVTKSWGYENMVLIDDANVTGLPSLMGNNMIYNTTAYLSSGSHTLELLDSFGDGWHGGYTTVNGVTYGTDFNSGGYKSYDFTV